MKLIIILLHLMVLAKTQHKVSYDNYKFYEIWPLTNENINFLKSVKKTHRNFSFWKHPKYPNNSVNLMVPPDEDEDFIKIMQHKNSVQYKLVFRDVQKLLDEDERFGKKPKPPKPTNPPHKPFNFQSYQSWASITGWFGTLKKRFPGGKIKIICIGRTYEGRKIQGVRLSFSKIRKPGVFIEGGMHGCERISVSTVNFILNEFLYTTNPDVRSLAEKYDWYFFPVINPDGYIYSSTKYVWRKTMSNQCDDQRIKCLGVDPNRNFGYLWMKYGGSSNECSPVFSGESPFSERETRSLARFVKLISHRLFAYISFHSRGKVLTFPYGHTKDPLDNYEELLAIGKKATAALQMRRGTIFKIGNVASVLYHVTATSTDWVKAALKLPIVFTYILDDTIQFSLPPGEIVPVGNEVVDSFVALFNEAAKFGYPKPLS